MARKTANPRKPSMRDEGAQPHAMPLSEYVPSADHVFEVYHALWRFTQCFGLCGRRYDRQEDLWLPEFCRLADALRPAWQPIGETEGWPPIVRHALAAIVEAFDATTEAWRWEAVAQPEPGRSAHLAACREWHAEQILAPTYRTALGWQAAYPSLERRKCDRDAAEGFAFGHKPEKLKLTEMEWEIRYEEAADRRRATPIYGGAHPRMDRHSPEYRAFNDAFHALRDVLLDVDRDRAAVPEAKGGRP